MTEQDKEAIVGRAILAEKKNNETLAALDSELRETTECLQAMVYGLNNHQQQIEFQPDAVRTPTHQTEYRRIPLKVFNMSLLQNLLQDRKQCLETRRKLHDELVRLGVRNQTEEITFEDIGKFRQRA